MNPLYGATCRVNGSCSSAFQSFSDASAITSLSRKELRPLLACWRGSAPLSAGVTADVVEQAALSELLRQQGAFLGRGQLLPADIVHQDCPCVSRTLRWRSISSSVNSSMRSRRFAASAPPSGISDLALAMVSATGVPEPSPRVPSNSRSVT